MKQYFLTELKSCLDSLRMDLQKFSGILQESEKEKEWGHRLYSICQWFCIFISYIYILLYIFYKYVSYIIKPIHRQHNYWPLITIHLTHSFLIHSKYFTKLYRLLFPHLKLCKFSILSLFSPHYFYLILYMRLNIVFLVLYLWG